MKKHTFSLMLPLALLLLLALPSKAQFSDLKGGLNGEVFTLHVHDNKLWVAGSFTQAGTNPGIPVNGLALWDGSNWTAPPMANHPAGHLIRDMETYQGNIVFAGDFVQPHAQLTQWDGTAFQSLEGGNSAGPDLSNGRIHCLHTRGPLLYVGGKFTHLQGNIRTNNIAAFDGRIWLPLGSATDPGVTGGDPVVLCISNYLSGIAVGGRFIQAGTLKADKVARWDGTNWHSTQSETTANNQGGVIALIDDSGTLYAYGNFQRIGGSLAPNLAQMKVGGWFPLSNQNPINVPGNLLPENMRGDLLLESITLHVGGQFTGTGLPAPPPYSAISLNTQNPILTRFHTNYDGVMTSPQDAGKIADFITFQGKIYFAGSFDRIKGNGVPDIHRENISALETTTDRPSPHQTQTIHCYPNPTTGTINLSLPGNQKIHLHLIDVQGRQLLSQILPPGQHQLQLDHLPAGIYHLHFHNQQIHQTQIIHRHPR